MHECHECIWMLHHFAKYNTYHTCHEYVFESLFVICSWCIMTICVTNTFHKSGLIIPLASTETRRPGRKPLQPLQPLFRCILKFRDWEDPPGNSWSILSIPSIPNSFWKDLESHEIEPSRVALQAFRFLRLLRGHVLSQHSSLQIVLSAVCFLPDWNMEMQILPPHTSILPVLAEISLIGQVRQWIPGACSTAHGSSQWSQDFPRQGPDIFSIFCMSCGIVNSVEVCSKMFETFWNAINVFNVFNVQSAVAAPVAAVGHQRSAGTASRCGSSQVCCSSCCWLC